ncbi:LpxI family protein [Sedimentitalea todarodis]|uniref:UDP-2,3-diacylglucosamine diphosphatase LpxI n=1 Tax=Sedimentitalea todarodis TaxID=1631240 RepID=A0ABU3VB05_9RHOB|nr:UDP-2,3-diacylglucosamine diphosphatase LpxI [Sedimentitalea todarodis]MDU9003347.1 UDP-2,3-diacylglucosamine diphosphatase LpxI [Sedimentitalea todarodis]
MGLALIAGAGGLPHALVRQLETRPVVCALAGFEPDNLQVDETFRLETLGSLLAGLKTRAVREICLAGSINRPVIDPSAIDTATMPLVPLLQQALTRGDDGALRAVISVFEQAGFAVRSAHEIAPGLLPAAGCMTDCEPDDRARADAARAEEIVNAMSAVDVGQCCVVQAGQALAIETVYGTDWMLQSLSARPEAEPRGGLLFKAPKRNQDMRADMPTIGVDTIAAAAAVGLQGVVIETDGVMVLDQAEVGTACDRAGLFLWVRDRSH